MVCWCEQGEAVCPLGASPTSIFNEIETNLTNELQGGHEVVHPTVDAGI